jgi:peptidylprolyl isomerase
MFRLFAGSLAVAAMLAATVPAVTQPRPAASDPQNTILIDTRHGRITVRLRPDLAPRHAERIKLLAREKFYDNVPFHRVMTDFMAQTGDGQNRNGTGGSKHGPLQAEFSSVPFTRGIVGMASTNQPNSANSQFFIMLGEAPFLNGKYTVIGEVTQGMDAVDKIKKAPPEDRGGTVVNPDVMTRVQVAADAK